MPGADAEAETAAMDNAVEAWRLTTASRLHSAGRQAGGQPDQTRTCPEGGTYTAPQLHETGAEFNKQVVICRMNRILCHISLIVAKAGRKPRKMALLAAGHPACHVGENGA